MWREKLFTAALSPNYLLYKLYQFYRQRFMFVTSGPGCTAAIRLIVHPVF
jgi:hypothetical protein